MLYDQTMESGCQVMKEDWRQVLLDAADLLEKIGWCKERFVQIEITLATSTRTVIAYCAVGAIRATKFSDKSKHEAEFHLAVEIAGPRVPAWNDAQTDASIVINKMREVATEK